MSHRITGRVTGQRKGRKNLVNIIMYLKASRVSRCYINAFMPILLGGGESAVSLSTQ